MSNKYCHFTRLPRNTNHHHQPIHVSHNTNHCPDLQPYNTHPQHPHPTYHSEHTAMASLDRATEAEEYVAAPGFYRPSTTLPITAHKRALLYAISTYPVTILIGETGSGKTTQLPQFLHASGAFTSDGKMVACTQPRRVAATTVALRVAEEMGVSVGDEVGYSIRFEDMTGPRTRIKYMTDGMLLREALVDPLLSRYSVVMVDEAHERSLATDVLLGVLKKVRRKRKDMRLVVSSATLQAEEFLRFFEEGDEEGVATVVGIEGRCYPVDCLYLEEPAEDYVERAVQTVFDIHLKVLSLSLELLVRSC